MIYNNQRERITNVPPPPCKVAVPAIEYNSFSKLPDDITLGSRCEYCPYGSDNYYKQLDNDEDRFYDISKRIEDK